MKKNIILFVTFINIFSYSVFNLSHAAEPSSNLINSEHGDPIKIINVFFQAVKRGELIIFDKKIDKSMLIPIRVEYVYELDGSKPTINVYSDLKYKLPIPKHDGIYVRGVSTILNDTGRIIEVRAHVFTEN